MASLGLKHLNMGCTFYMYDLSRVPFTGNSHPIFIPILMLSLLLYFPSPCGYFKHQSVSLKNGKRFTLSLLTHVVINDNNNNNNNNNKKGIYSTFRCSGNMKQIFAINWF